MDWIVYWFMLPACVGIAGVAMFSGISGAARLIPLFLIGFPLLGAPQLTTVAAVGTALLLETSGFGMSVYRYLHFRLVDTRTARYLIRHAAAWGTWRHRRATSAGASAAAGIRRGHGWPARWRSSFAPMRGPTPQRLALLRLQACRRSSVPGERPAFHWCRARGRVRVRSSRWMAGDTDTRLAGCPANGSTQAWAPSPPDLHRAVPRDQRGLPAGLHRAGVLVAQDGRRLGERAHQHCRAVSSCWSNERDADEARP